MSALLMVLRAREAWTQEDEDKHPRGTGAKGGEFVSKNADNSKVGQGHRPMKGQKPKPEQKKTQQKPPQKQQAKDPKKQTKSPAVEKVETAKAKPLRLRRGDSGPEVRKLQALLNSLGISTPSNGTFGYDTERAVREVQQKLGLKPTGRVSSALLRRLADAKKLSPCVKESITALDLVREARRMPDFNAALHPRDDEGKFRTVFARVNTALTAWAKGDGPDRPVSALKLSRPSLMKVSRKIGYEPSRGESAESIEDGILARAREIDKARQLDAPDVPDVEPKAPDVERLFTAGDREQAEWILSRLTQSEFESGVADPSRTRKELVDASRLLGLSTSGTKDALRKRLVERAAELRKGGKAPDAPEPDAGTPDAPVPAGPDLDRQVAEAETRVRVMRERLDKAQAALDRASRDPKADALGEHFPLGVGGSGGGRKGSTDTQLRRLAEAYKARDAASHAHAVAELQLKELTARRDAAGKYGRDTVSAGDAIKVDGKWWRVQKSNAKTVQVDAGPGYDLKYRWDRVTDHRRRPSPDKAPSTPPVTAPTRVNQPLLDAAPESPAVAKVQAAKKAAPKEGRLTLSPRQRELLAKASKNDVIDVDKSDPDVQALVAAGYIDLDPRSNRAEINGRGALKAKLLRVGDAPSTPKAATKVAAAKASKPVDRVLSPKELEDFDNRPPLTGLDFGAEGHNNYSKINETARGIAARWDVDRADLVEVMREDGATVTDADSLDDLKERFAGSRLLNHAGGGDVLGEAVAASVADRLGLPYQKPPESVIDYIRDRPAMRRALDGFGWAMYQQTQDWFRQRGITEVTAARGTKLGGDRPDMLYSSWTTSYSKIRTGTEGASPEDLIGEGDAPQRPVRVATIPVDRILSNPATGYGTLNEFEMTVLSGAPFRGKAAPSKAAKAPAKHATPRVPKEAPADVAAKPSSTDEVLSRLAHAQSLDEAKAYLESLNLSVAGLRKLATDLDVRIIKPTKAGIVNDIVKVKVSGRLGTDVLGRIPELWGVGPRPAAWRPPSFDSASADVDNRIRDVYASLPKSDTGFVSIADIRDKLGDLSREDQDAALRRLATSPDAEVIPIANAKSIAPRFGNDPRIRDAGIVIGGEEQHAIRFPARKS